jgi:hypothetical protein
MKGVLLGPEELREWSAAEIPPTATQMKENPGSKWRSQLEKPVDMSIIIAPDECQYQQRLPGGGPTTMKIWHSLFVYGVEVALEINRPSHLAIRHIQIGCQEKPVRRLFLAAIPLIHTMIASNIEKPRLYDEVTTVTDTDTNVNRHERLSYESESVIRLQQRGISF